VAPLPQCRPADALLRGDGSDVDRPDPGVDGMDPDQQLGLGQRQHPAAHRPGQPPAGWTPPPGLATRPVVGIAAVRVAVLI
jgi:hypothetical protein